MDNPRPEKVAVVEEVRDKLSTTEAVVLIEKNLAKGPRRGAAANDEGEEKAA